MTTLVEITDHGFECIEFTDQNGVECSLQQSSAIDLNTDDGIKRRGSSLIWLGCNNVDPQYFVPNGNPAWRPTRMHLNREQVEALIVQLQAWLKTGYFA